MIITNSLRPSTCWNHSGKLLAGTQSHGDGWKMMFLFNWMIFRFQPLIFQGCNNFCKMSLIRKSQKIFQSFYQLQFGNWISTDQHRCFFMRHRNSAPMWQGIHLQREQQAPSRKRAKNGRFEGVPTSVNPLNTQLDLHHPFWSPLQFIQWMDRQKTLALGESWRNLLFLENDEATNPTKNQELTVGL